jgi:peptidoglycan-N-acetylglucosamine deacetylase
MDPDSSSYFSSSSLLKASLITITFTTIYFYKTEKRLSFINLPFLKKDTEQVIKLPETIVKKKKLKTIYLTFDDGPNKGTSNVMSIINEEQVPATMFIIGEHVYGSAEQRSIWNALQNNNLFEIANHSYTHALENKFVNFYANPDTVVKDFKRCADSLGLISNIVRTPGRNIWRTENIHCTDLKKSEIAADSLHSKGFIAMGWDLEWHFTNNQRLVESDSVIISEIKNMFAKAETKTADNLVILAHDRTFLSANDSASLHRLIKELKSSDEYNFETINKYPGLQ